MATIAPMAEWKPFTGKGTTPLTYDIVCVHTMVGKLMGSWDWANQPGNSYWHFGLGADGRLLQCHPLEYKSAANLDGNWHVIPIETEDGYSDGRTSDAGQVWQSWSGSNVPSWTTAQVDKLVDVIAWLCKKYDIPPVLIPDTKQGRRGLAYHRQGINPWRVSGGEKWSNSDGKVCPGDRRVAQFEDVVVPRVAAIVNGDDGGFHLVDETDKTILRNIIRQELYGDETAHNKGITAIIRNEVKAAVDDRFKTGGTATREQIAGDQAGNVTSLVELGLQRSPTFKALVDKVDALAPVDE